MNSNKVDIRVFAAVLGFLFLTVGTVFASSNRYCRSEAMACCMPPASHSLGVQCTGGKEASRPVPVGESGSCCTTITAAAENTSVAVVGQDNLRNNQRGSSGAAPVTLSAPLAQPESPLNGRIALHDSHLRTSVAKYLLTSTLLI